MSRELSAPFRPVAVAVYLPEQYPRLLATADDAHALEATWQEWYQIFQETRQELTKLGIYVVEITVDLDGLDAFCQRRGLSNTSSTRAEYAAHMLSERHRQTLPSLRERTGKKKRRKHR